MRILIILLLMANCVFGSELPKLPDGITIDTIPDNFTRGVFYHYLHKNNEIIGTIAPATWNESEIPGTEIISSYYAELYNAYKRDTFLTKMEALIWLIATIEDYYQPVVIEKWKKLETQPPKVSLEYPWDWSYKLEKYGSIFKSKSLNENKLVIMMDDLRGHSEILQIIRTPNTGNVTTAEIIKMSVQMNRAIDLQLSPAVDTIIGGKTFKTVQNTFMEQMWQWHYWYTDNNEIIYIGANLLKDDRFRYPNVIQQILNSIKW
ncbi:MAG: hypothetical protein M9958_03455 [Chitinophagales bacterium]|nr:hypothetical protein [Chitinophagales bacterium]